jgi:hypothetical protein
MMKRPTQKPAPKPAPTKKGEMQKCHGTKKK